MMAIRSIRVVGDPVLHSATRPVTEFDAELGTLIDDLFDTMAAADGVGLAANQVGVDLRVFVYDCPDGDGVQQRGAMVNPFTETTQRPETMPDPDDDWEGCLSVPGEAFPTGRADWTRVIGADVNAQPVTVEGTGYLARCLQHETDHLDGVVYLDRLVGRYRREAKKMLRAHGWGVPGLAWDPAASLPRE